MRNSLAFVAAVALGYAPLAKAGAAEPVPAAVASGPQAIELLLVGADKVARLEIQPKLNGIPIAEIWNETFAKLFAYFDRNADGSLDAKEAALLPAPRALRHAMTSGFTPPVGAAPTFAELDRDSDGKATLQELVACYRAAGVGEVLAGAGRLPASGEISAALVKYLDLDRDGKLSQSEWQAAVEKLQKLDKNDDELISATELVPKAAYPGASGTTLLAAPSAAGGSELLAKLPLVRLPAQREDTFWAAEIAQRNPRLKADDLIATRHNPPDAKWTIDLGDSATAEPFTMTAGGVRVDGWGAKGKLSEALASAREQISGLSDAPPKQTEEDAQRRGATGRRWLVPTADRNGDGKLDQAELDRWFDLQAQIARGQALITILDGAELFEFVDSNHDAVLSVRELRDAWGRLKQVGMTSQGKLELPRMTLIVVSQGYPERYGILNARGPAWFRAMDRNGDGDVSSREFTGPVEVFQKLDVDHDGLLSAAEVEKADFGK